MLGYQYSITKSFVAVLQRLLEEYNAWSETLHHKMTIVRIGVRVRATFSYFTLVGFTLIKYHSSLLEDNSILIKVVDLSSKSEQWAGRRRLSNRRFRGALQMLHFSLSVHSTSRPDSVRHKNLLMIWIVHLNKEDSPLCISRKLQLNE
jgi:hypothetical protein